MTTRDAVFGTYSGDLPWLEEHTGYLTFAGSLAYGTSTPASDVDVRGIACPPPEYILGFHKKFDHVEWKGTRLDIAIGSVHKFARLATRNTPGALEMLFTEEKDVLHLGVIGKVFRGIRTSFLSKRAFDTFGGYARSMLSKACKEGRSDKPAMHAVRLLRMGMEILEKGEVIVKRPDADELIAIGDGSWTKDQLTGWCKIADARMHALVQRTKLPKEPNYEHIDHVVTELTRGLLHEEYLHQDAAA